MVNRPTVLVTGATGFIGRAVCTVLEETGWSVLQAVRNAAASVQTSIAMNLDDPASILGLEKTTHCDAIVHLAAKIGWSGALEEEMFAPNVLSSGCFAYLAKRWNAHLVFASAAVVHGVRQAAISENTPILVDTPYAKTKRLAEQLIGSANPAHCILRIGGVFGFQGPEHLGLNRAISKAALHQEQPVQVGKGSALRNYVYVKDVAQAIAFVLQQRLIGAHLLAGHQTVSIGEMMQTLCDVFVPGKMPLLKEGAEATDQVIVPSSFLPMTRSFHDALLDIQEEASH